MKRWLAACLAGLCLHAAAAVTVVDDRGKAVTLPRPPQRIVSLLPSVTESICELGACGRLVGVDDWSNWPEQARRLPHVGGLEDARPEDILALKPDLVLVLASARTLPRLEALGVPAIGLEIKTFADVRRVLETLGELLAVPGAAAAWQRIEAGMAQAARELPPPARGARVYFEVGGGYAAGEASHIGQLLARLGASSVVPARLGSVPQLNPEFVVRADPDLIMVPERAAHGLLDRPGWRRMTAVREGRVCVFPAAQADVVMRPGPRLDEAARILARCLRDKSARAAAR